MNKISDGWATYSEHVLPAEATANQAKETKRAFYAGAHQTLCSMLNVSGDLTEEEAMKAIVAMHRESKDFVELIKKGKA